MRRSMLLVCLLAASAASAKTYYVAPKARGGSDRKPGTLAAPFATLKKGAAVLRPGDQLYVRGGTYHESLSVWEKRGSSDNPIHITAYPGEKPVIDGTGTTASNAVVSIGDASWIRFDGFEVKNGPKSGIAVYDSNNVKIRSNDVHHNQEFGIHIGSGEESPFGKTHDVDVEGNKVHDNVLSNSKRTSQRGWGQAIGTIRASRVDITGNYVSENYGEGIDLVVTDRGRIIDNTVSDNFSVNIYLDNATRAVVDRNFVVTGWSAKAQQYYRGGTPAMGIHTENEKYRQQTPLNDLTITNNIVVNCRFGFSYSNSERGGGLHNTLIANNTFVRPTDLVLYIENGPKEIHDRTVIVNNIFYARGTDYVDAPSPAIRYLTNCWYGGKRDTQKRGPGDVLADPAFVNAGGGDKSDYKLTAGSPCIDKGTLERRVTNDFFGKPRARAALDIGAHEF